MASFNLPDTMQVAFTANFLDALGNSTTVINPVVAMDNTTVATVNVPNPPASGTPVSSVTGVISAVGPLGTSNLTVSATNPDNSTVTGVQAIVVVTSYAMSIQFALGIPTPIPTPA